jgi:hypothetical protein
VFTRPAPVIAGIVLHYLVMPLAAWTIAKALHMPPDLTAGMVLVGSVAGGTASNVMIYLARGDVALSVTISALSTSLASSPRRFSRGLPAERLVIPDGQSTGHLEPVHRFLVLGAEPVRGLVPFDTQRVEKVAYGLVETDLAVQAKQKLCLRCGLVEFDTGACGQVLCERLA